SSASTDTYCKAQVHTSAPTTDINRPSMHETTSGPTTLDTSRHPEPPNGSLESEARPTTPGAGPLIHWGRHSYQYDASWSSHCCRPHRRQRIPHPGCHRSRGPTALPTPMRSATPPPRSAPPAWGGPPHSPGTTLIAVRRLLVVPLLPPTPPATDPPPRMPPIKVGERTAHHHAFRQPLNAVGHLGMVGVRTLPPGAGDPHPRRPRT